MLYAMINEYRVIDIVNAETAPSWPPNQIGNPVTAIECSEEVKIGMSYNEETGEFSEYIPMPIPTQLDRIEEQLKLTYTEAQEQAVDAYTKELLDGGII
ncbi:hypothetical protein [Anaerotignum sp. MSJ-24]|uniref:hypothetical protein n=1 Tax=Anaerotignum sp. MSJ-24 TaxID=2841521 RepID=UPI001C11C59A|nr:hypothetical protein [Anaerotignum sp. MSJ-24]MBU5464980.1 hypothetical protein [Anaerotignum sp. MSJ-24]